MMTLNIYFKCNLFNNNPFNNKKKIREFLRVQCSVLTRVDRSKNCRNIGDFHPFRPFFFFHYIGDLSSGADISAIFATQYIAAISQHFPPWLYHSSMYLEYFRMEA